MAKSGKQWKRGRGKLGLLTPLIGNWTANASTPMGSVTCTRRFELVLGGNYVRLSVRWEFEKGAYEEIGFEAQMPAGLARMAYWPDDSDGFHCSVEAKNKKGWKRFTEHHYRRA